MAEDHPENPVKLQTKGAPAIHPRIQINVELAQGVAVKITASVTTVSGNQAQVIEARLPAAPEPGEVAVQAESELPSPPPSVEMAGEPLNETANLSWGEAQTLEEQEPSISAGRAGPMMLVREWLTKDLPASWRVARASAALFLALIPPFLVFRDRWLEDPAYFSGVKELWCRIPFLCQLGFPDYFPVVLISVIFAAGLVWLWSGAASPFKTPAHILEPLADRREIPESQRRASRWALILAGGVFTMLFFRTAISQVRPGFGLVAALLLFLLGLLLREIHWRSWPGWLEKNGDLLASLLLAHVALLVFLSSVYSVHGWNWAAALFLLVAVVNLLRLRSRIPGIFWIVNLALVLQSWDLRAWWGSVIGDEYSFFNFAREIVTLQTFSQINEKLFRGLAVYGTHPYLSSLLQAFFFKLFGSHNFAWRISSVYLSAGSILFFYLFFKRYVARWQALFAAFLLACSSYLMDFARIGYNNTQALVMLGVVLWLASLALESNRLLVFALLGLGMGFCFYVYPAALYALPAPLLLHALLGRPVTRRLWQGWGIALLMMLALLYPLFFQPDYWAAKKAGIFLNNPALLADVSVFFRHLASNMVYALFSFLYISKESHFVVSSYVDPLSGVLVVLGLAWLLRLAWSNMPARFFALSFAGSLLLVGASHDRQFPSTTRMFLFLPLFSLLAVLGLTWLREQFLSWLNHRLAMGLFVALGLLILGLNIDQAYNLSLRRAGGYQQIEALYLRAAQEIFSDKKYPPMAFVFVTDSTWGIDGIRLLQDVYEIPPSQDDLIHLKLDSSLITEQEEQVLSNRSNIIIMTSHINPQWRPALDAELARLGRTRCPVTNVNGDYRFDMWYSGELSELCK